MCKSTPPKQHDMNTPSSTSNNPNQTNSNSNSNTTTTTTTITTKEVRKPLHQRRDKRQRQSSLLPNAPLKTTSQRIRVKKSRSRLRQKHADDEPSGGIEAIIPSLIIVIVLAWGYAAKMGFRGRPSVAGVDLGTTNSVICVREEKGGAHVGTIECIPDPFNNSPIVPSVISILDPHDSSSNTHRSSSDSPLLDPNPVPPSRVIIGSAAKQRIDTHPHHTLYHAKRVIGRLCNDRAVRDLSDEVEFGVSCNTTFPIGTDTDTGIDVHNSELNQDDDNDTDTDTEQQRLTGEEPILFQTPHHSTPTQTLSLSPHSIGSYIIHYLFTLTHNHLRHTSVQSAVVAVPANFDEYQRAATIRAFREVGVGVTRVLEEPVAAALAYGLEKKSGVNYIMVYDFGGGTLDVSLLYVNDDGYVDVMGSDGDNSLGGVDFDIAVAHSLLGFNDGYNQRVVDRITNILTEMDHLFGEEGEEDLDEQLSSQCQAIEQTPLCTFSSFHTIGEKMKIRLSDETEDDVQATCLGLTQKPHTVPRSVPELCSLLEPIHLTLTLNQYNDACRPLYEKSLLPIRRILDDTNLERSEIDEVVMVGGTTRMPQIRELVRDELGMERLNIDIDPDLTVAYGAASVVD